MAGGYSIGVAADTRAFDSAVKQGIIDPVEDAQEALEDLARTGSKAGDSLDLDDARRDLDKLGKSSKESGNTLERSMKDAQRETGKTTAEIREATRAIEEQTRRVKQEGSKTFEPASESSRAFRDEAKSNLSEVVSSFDGSAQSIGDLVQGTLGGVIADLGPLGLAAGALAAVGVGFIISKVQETEAEQERLRQKTSELADEYIDTGRVGEASVSFLADAMRDLATQTEKGEDNLTSLRKEAKNAGVDVRDFQLANAGSAKSTERSLAQARKEYQRLADAMRDGNGVNSGLTKSEQRRQVALGQTIGTLLDLRKAQEDAAQSAKDYADSGAEAAQQAGEAAATYSDAVQAAYADAGASVEDFVKDGVFQLDAYQASTQKNLDAIVGYQKNMSEAQGILAKSGHDEAMQYLQSLGKDAAPLIQAFVDAPKAKQQELATIWEGLGQASSTSFGNKLQSDLDATTIRKTVEVDADTSKFDAAAVRIRDTKLVQTVDVFVNERKNQYVAPRSNP